MFLGVFPLPFLTSLGLFSLVIALAGLILVLISLKGLSDYHKENGIFKYALFGFIAAVVGGLIALALALTAAVGLFQALGINIENATNLTTMPQINYQNVDINALTPYLLTLLASLIILLIFSLAMAIMIRKSLGLLSKKTGVSLFSTTGLIMVIGAGLTVILIGLFLLRISLLLLSIAFFSIRPQQIQAPLPIRSPNLV